MKIIEELKTVIAESGKSLNLIEGESGIGRGILSRFVNGQRDLSLESAARLADYFGLHFAPTAEEAKRHALRLAAVPMLLDLAERSLDRLKAELDMIRKVAEGADVPDFNAQLKRLAAREAEADRAERAGVEPVRGKSKRR